jgi:hypothetical protein
MRHVICSSSIAVEVVSTCFGYFMFICALQIHILTAVYHRYTDYRRRAVDSLKEIQLLRRKM